MAIYLAIAHLRMALVRKRQAMPQVVGGGIAKISGSVIRRPVRSLLKLASPVRPIWSASKLAITGAHSAANGTASILLMTGKQLLRTALAYLLLAVLVIALLTIGVTIVKTYLVANINTAKDLIVENVENIVTVPFRAVDQAHLAAMSKVKDMRLLVENGLTRWTSKLLSVTSPVMRPLYLALDRLELEQARIQEDNYCLKHGKNFSWSPSGIAKLALNSTTHQCVKSNGDAYYSIVPL